MKYIREWWPAPVVLVLALVVVWCCQHSQGHIDDETPYVLTQMQISDEGEIKSSSWVAVYLGRLACERAAAKHVNTAEHVHALQKCSVAKFGN